MFSYSGGTVGFYDTYRFPSAGLLDHVLSPVLGKNLIALARRD